MLDDILNRVPTRAAPYVGASAFAHKAGLHASAILKDPSTYEHIDPAVVGNAAHHSDEQSGGPVQPAHAPFRGMGLEVPKGDDALGRILERIKDREDGGYSYDTAQASFELIARDELGQLPRFFEVEALSRQYRARRARSPCPRP